ncbi:hypothetical protein KAR91_70815 [Candidatus Pacearchaeota archaeon]|nr:hypothetical protein [Candidatus Pacearchaeota archaeon]
MAKFIYQNGKEVKDLITGFRGVVMGRADYLTGCNQYLIQPTESKDDGTYPTANWFDEGRLELIGDKFSEKDVKTDDPGSDYTAPIK